MSDIFKARLEFSNWVKLWVNSNLENTSKEKVVQPDILEIMTIFKILGFDITFTEVSDPNDMPKLQNSGDGIKIIATCSTSGMRGVMELETRCKCPKKLIDPKLWDDNKQNDLVKYTIDKEEVNALIAVPPEIEYIIQSVTNHFLHLIKINDQNANDIQIKTKTPAKELQTVSHQAITQTITKSPKTKIFSRQHTFLNIYAYNPTIEVTSPARYRSLDTLTGDVNLSEIPEPGKLRKNDSNDKNLQFFKSSNLNMAKIRRPSTSSPCENGEQNILGYNKLLAAQTLINEVLGIMENKQNADKLNFDVSKIKGSVDSLIEKPLGTIPAQTTATSASKVPPTKLKCRAPIRSSGSLKPSVSKSPMIRPISKSTSSAPATKSLENVSGGIVQRTPTIKPNPKYMHIKSTISKTKTIITTKK